MTSSHRKPWFRPQLLQLLLWVHQYCRQPHSLHGPRSLAIHLRAAIMTGNGHHPAQFNQWPWTTNTMACGHRDRTQILDMRYWTKAKSDNPLSCYPTHLTSMALCHNKTWMVIHLHHIETFQVGTQFRTARLIRPTRQLGFLHSIWQMAVRRHGRRRTHSLTVDILCIATHHLGHPIPVHQYRVICLLWVGSPYLRDILLGLAMDAWMEVQAQARLFVICYRKDTDWHPFMSCIMSTSYLIWQLLKLELSVGVSYAYCGILAWRYVERRHCVLPSQ
jgi:hypothetical protein